MKEPLVVLRTGMITSVGFDAPSTCAAIRAGIAGFQESGFFRSPPGLEPIVAAIVPMRPRPGQGQPFFRILAMVEHALKQCVTNLHTTPARCALLLGVREEYRADLAGGWDENDLLPKLQTRMKVRFHKRSEVFPLGNASVFFALQRAYDLLSVGDVDCCIVGGVDSFLQAGDLKYLEESFRLLGGPVGQGLIPGEAAALVAVSLPSLVAGKPLVGKILGIGTAQEDPVATVLQDGHPTGFGLERAMHAAITPAEIRESQIGFHVSDLNGESYRGIESMLASTRFYRTRREQFEIVHPADCVGETGAASGAIMMAVALTAMNKNYAPSRLAMCESSSDSGLRAACLVGI